MDAPDTQKAAKSNSIIAVFIALFIVIVVGLIVLFVRAVSPQQPQVAAFFPPLPTAAPTAQPLDYVLATLNAGGYVSKDDITILRFHYLLGSLSSKTGDTQKTIADMTVTTHDLIKHDYGRDIKLLDMMEEANNVAGTSMAGRTYKEIMALEVVYYGQ